MDTYIKYITYVCKGNKITYMLDKQSTQLSWDCRRSYGAVP